MNHHRTYYGAGAGLWCCFLLSSLFIYYFPVITVRTICIVKTPYK